MSAFHQPARLGSSFLRPFLRTTPRTTLQPSYKRFASQDYGSGEGSPEGEKPQEQGKNPRSDLEHPGEKAPDTGGSSKGQDTQQSKPSSSSSSDGGAGGNQKKQEVKGSQPKILSENKPDLEDPDVKKHNEEMAQRHDKPKQQIPDKKAGDEKVDPEYWAGKTAKP